MSYRCEKCDTSDKANHPEKNMLSIDYFFKDFTFTLNPDKETTFIKNVFLIECLFQ